LLMYLEIRRRVAGGQVKGAETTKKAA
jgi:hypothetical protein